MIQNGKYASAVLACSPEIQGTAICHKGGKCSACRFARSYELLSYLNQEAKRLGCWVVPSIPLFESMGYTLQEFGRPLCPSEPQGWRLPPIFCPCEEGKDRIREKGACPCGIFVKPKCKIS